jgi:hypothetical protein
MWKLPSDGMGFDEYLESQGIPIIHIPFVARLDSAPTTETGEYAVYEREPESDEERLRRILHSEMMRSKMARNERDHAKLARDRAEAKSRFWRGAFVVAVIVATWAVTR